MTPSRSAQRDRPGAETRAGVLVGSPDETFGAVDIGAWFAPGGAMVGVLNRQDGVVPPADDPRGDQFRTRFNLAPDGSFYWSVVRLSGTMGVVMIGPRLDPTDAARFRRRHPRGFLPVVPLADGTRMLVKVFRMERPYLPNGRYWPLYREWRWDDDAWELKPHSGGRDATPDAHLGIDRWLALLGPFAFGASGPAPDPDPALDPIPAELRGKAREYLRLWRAGLTETQIGAQLVVKPKSVGNTIRRLRRRFGPKVVPGHRQRRN